MSIFESIDEEKRGRVINAAMGVFATYGYHKASVADIARAAGISKAMVFTYFGSKCGCYDYLCQHMLKVSVAEFNKYKEQIFAETDYFERIILSVTIKIAILKRYSTLLDFASSVFNERDTEVSEIIAKILAEGYALREIFLSRGIDASKFKEPNDAKRVAKIIEWLSYGFADQWSRRESCDLDDMLQEFIDCVVMLKKNFYKEEHL